MSLREFLEAKADEYRVRDRHRLRVEWIASLNQLLKQLQEWLREADPEGLLDIIKYEVARTERGLGTYDAPAMKIRFGPAEVDVLPITMKTTRPILVPASGGATMSGARVDVTDGYRKYNLVRSFPKSDEPWLIRDERGGFEELTRESFERMLQDLLS